MSKKPTSLVGGRFSTIASGSSSAARACEETLGDPAPSAPPSPGSSGTSPPDEDEAQPVSCWPSGSKMTALAPMSSGSVSRKVRQRGGWK